MDRKPTEPKQTGKEKSLSFPATMIPDDEEEELDDKKRRSCSASNSVTIAKRGPGAEKSSQPVCRAENCSADLSKAKLYHRRHEVCEAHSKALVVIVAGMRQRFCQQCSRFHELSEFDGPKRSCRKRLTDHNERRKKGLSDLSTWQECRLSERNAPPRLHLPLLSHLNPFDVRKLSSSIFDSPAAVESSTITTDIKPLYGSDPVVAFGSGRDWKMHSRARGIGYEKSKKREKPPQRQVQSDSEEVGDNDVEVEAAYAQKIPSFPTRSVYGREEEKEELIKLLLRFNGTSSADVVSIISITGAAGIGKTTLAQTVYNDGIVREHFSLRVWLSLPYQFDLIWLFQAILWCIEEPEGMGKGTSCFKPWLSKTTTESPAMDNIILTLIHDLSEKLAGERFLLVLDDFQMEDPLLLRTLRNHHLVAKIIVTTRKESVAAILQAEEVYHLKGLQEDKCWNLFQENGCLTRDIVNSKQLEYIGKQIIRNCDGVPLAVKMLGSLLRDIQDEKIWYNVLCNMQGSNVTGGVLLQAVRETYEFMPTHLKPCLAYCSAFPRDFKFKKDELVNLWVAEGLIQYRSGSKTIEDIGMEYFDDLQRRSHLKPCLAYCSAFPRGCKLEEDKLAKLWMAEGSIYSGSKTLEDMGTDMWRRSYFHCSDVGIFSLLDLVHDLSEKFEIERDLLQTSSGEAVYGRENDKRKVIKLLLSDDCRKRDVSVIHIVGSGGVGKTTLANLIYNDCTV